MHAERAYCARHVGRIDGSGGPVGCRLKAAAARLPARRLQIGLFSEGVAVAGQLVVAEAEDSVLDRVLPHGLTQERARDDPVGRQH